jgi:hypothetical protein
LEKSFVNQRDEKGDRMGSKTAMPEVLGILFHFLAVKKKPKEKSACGI